MCTPAAAIVMMAASTAVSMYGQQQQAQAQSDAANYQAGIAANNAIIQERNAQRAEEQGNTAASTKMLETSQRMGAMRAAMAANGLDTSSGSPLNLQSDTAKVGSLDAQTIRNNAAWQAYGFRTGASSDLAQSQLYKSQAANDLVAGQNNMTASLVSGASNIGTKWVSYKTSGVVT